MCRSKGFGFSPVLVINRESIWSFNLVINRKVVLNWVCFIDFDRATRINDIIFIIISSHILKHNLKRWDLVSPSFYTICIDWMPWRSLACSSFSCSVEVAIDQHQNNTNEFSIAQDRNNASRYKIKSAHRIIMWGISPHLRLDDLFDLCFRTVKFWLYKVHSSGFDKHTNCS